MGGAEFGGRRWRMERGRGGSKATDLEAKIEQVRLPFGAAMLSAGASAGVAMLDPNADVAGTIDAADKAMYARKRERKA